MTTHVLRHHALLAPGLSTFKSLSHFTIEHFLLLPIGGAIALLWANTRPDSYFAMTHTMSFVVNEIGMALFFALITQEVVEELMPGGALHTWKRWTVPAIAAAGGTIGAAAVYLAFVGFKYELVLVPGWPVAGAVDIAFAYFIVKAIFRRHAAVPFLLVLAIASDAFGMAAIASREAFVEVRPGGAVLMAGAIALAYAFRQSKVQAWWPYVIVCGPLSWWALYIDGFHPALALVPIMPFLRHSPRTLELFTETGHEHDRRRGFEHATKYPVQVVLFLFALVNAGVLLQGYGTGTWALLSAAVIGKPLGILAGTALAVACGLHLSPRLHWRDLAVVALATSGGFTFGLFFATAVFPVGPILGELKIGAVATGIGVPLAFAAARLLHAGRFGRHSPHSHPASWRPAGPSMSTIITLLVAAVLVAAPGVLAAEQRATATDEAIARAVTSRLTDHDIPGVSVMVQSGIVTLRGTVPTLWTKERAREEAHEADDVVAVVNELTVPRGENDEAVGRLVAARLQRYVFFTIFDDADVEVHGGVVTIRGRVTMPYKAEALADLAAHVPGVQEVRSDVRVLPVSRFDDQLRYAVARRIYGHDLFTRYAIQANPPVHIIVEHGRVTLTGVVFSEVERRMAEAEAHSTPWVLSVTNKLRIELEE